MKTIAIIAAAVAMTAAATPAFAKPEGTFGSAKVTYDAKSNSYCFKEVPTGSLIARSDCRTKAEWAQAGLTIAHKPVVQLAQR